MLKYVINNPPFRIIMNFLEYQMFPLVNKTVYGFSAIKLFFVSSCRIFYFSHKASYWTHLSNLPTKGKRNMR